MRSAKPSRFAAASMLSSSPSGGVAGGSAALATQHSSNDGIGVMNGQEAYQIVSVLVGTNRRQPLYSPQHLPVRYALRFSIAGPGGLWLGRQARRSSLPPADFAAVPCDPDRWWWAHPRLTLSPCPGPGSDRAVEALTPPGFRFLYAAVRSQPF
jgi:hypothetical protein